MRSGSEAAVVGTADEQHEFWSAVAEKYDRVVKAIRAACPGVPVGVSTGAWISPDAGQRLSFVKGWSVLPDFASVNVHEDGALELIRLLLDRGVGVEAGSGTPGLPGVSRTAGWRIAACAC